MLTMYVKISVRRKCVNPFWLNDRRPRAMATQELKPRERLTRERVIDAALRVMDTEGLDAVTMRRVAREVGVEAMSLFNHVRDKEDLLEAICGRVMSEYRVDQGSGPWIETARAAAQ